MFIVGLLRWWYGDGYLRRARLCMLRLESAMDYFSIGLLLKTMFALFRQDGAGRVDGSLGLKLRMFAERLISRFIGACVRSVVLVVGLLVITLMALVSVVILLAWGIMPFVPVIGCILAISGWVPWQS
ncbi:MAG: hypothetical protein Q4B06_01685 [Candidatus Saccharibacteria bacterium]|nr:hypothetical protein [Candidatus Saccharibacteria bacterium]